jgi:hypothetical protein
MNHTMLTGLFVLSFYIEGKKFFALFLGAAAIFCTNM